MLLTMHSVLGCPLIVRDGENGRVRDFLLDDHTWSFCFLSADMGRWFRHNRVLVPTVLVDCSTVNGRVVSVELLGSCPVKTDAESSDGRDHHRSDTTSPPQHFWHSTDLQMIAHGANSASLRSMRDLLDSEVIGIDGATIARVHDFEADNVSWTVHKLELRRGVGPFSRWATIDPGCVELVSWPPKTMQFDGTGESLQWSVHPQAAVRANRAS